MIRRMETLQRVIGTARPKFLLLALSCVGLGAATAVHLQGAIEVARLALVLAGALLAHASVNLLNEYEDFRSGLDLRTARTPFSGGSGILPAHPGVAALTLVAGVLTLAATAVIGLYFVSVHGAGLLPLGITGLALIAGYTRWVTRYPFLCLLAPGIGFGPLMVVGTAFVLTGHYSGTAWAASLVPLFLVSGLLLLNQFPDVEADREAGRRHLPILWGRRRSGWLFAGLQAGTCLSIVAGIAVGIFPVGVAAGLATAGIGLVISPGVLRHADDIDRLRPYMAWNLAATLTTPLLVACGFFLQ